MDTKPRSKASLLPQEFYLKDRHIEWMEYYIKNQETRGKINKKTRNSTSASKGNQLGGKEGCTQASMYRKSENEGGGRQSKREHNLLICPRQEEEEHVSVE